MRCVGCAPDKIYALCEGDRVVRFSFSRSLLSYLRRAYRPAADIRRVSFRTGRKLAPGELSATGLYAIVDRKKGTVLRVQTDAKLAAELTRCPSRLIKECGVVR